MIFQNLYCQLFGPVNLDNLNQFKFSVVFSQKHPNWCETLFIPLVSSRASILPWFSSLVYFLWLLLFQLPLNASAAYVVSFSFSILVIDPAKFHPQICVSNCIFPFRSQRPLTYCMSKTTHCVKTHTTSHILFLVNSITIDSDICPLPPFLSHIWLVNPKGSLSFSHTS